MMISPFQLFGLNSIDAMDNKFIKKFIYEGQISNLPDSDYWLSREELILTYLYQRGASVPQVQMKDLVKKALTLQNVGTSLNVFFNDLSYPEISNREALKILLVSIIQLQELLNFGVLHLDIALRNIASSKIQSDEFYILDFIHALSEHNQLQKPLPLLPTSELHHPMLIKALEADWNEYFKYIKQPTPKLDDSLTISNDDFSSYWINSSQIQCLCKSSAILSHGIGNLALEMANSINLEKSSRIIFRDFSNKLKFLDDKKSIKEIEHVKIVIIDILSKGPNNLVAKNIPTPIPKVRSKFSEIHNTFISPNFSQDKFSLQLDEIHNSSTLNKPIDLYLKEILPINEGLPVIKKTHSTIYTFGKFILCWSMILINVFLIDFIIKYENIVISNEIVLLIIIVGFSICLLWLLSIFLTKNKRAFLHTIVVLTITLTQFIVIGSYPKYVYIQLWTWLPSCFLGIFAFLSTLTLGKKFFKS